MIFTSKHRSRTVARASVSYCSNMIRARCQASRSNSALTDSQYEHHTDLRGLFTQQRVVLTVAVVTRHHGHAGRLHQLLRGAGESEQIKKDEDLLQGCLAGATRTFWSPSS